MLLRSTHEVRTDTAFSLEWLTKLRSFGEFNCADQTNAAHITHERMSRKFLQLAFQRG